MTSPIFTSPEEAETAFYAALSRADLDGMMAVWSEDEEVVCIHPGSIRLVGLAAIRESWRQLFAAGTRIIGPTQAVTQDYRLSRLNFEIGKDGRIAKISCY